jgi:hypothetical protein
LPENYCQWNVLYYCLDSYTSWTICVMQLYPSNKISLGKYRMCVARLCIVRKKVSKLLKLVFDRRGRPDNECIISEVQNSFYLMPQDETATWYKYSHNLVKKYSVWTVQMTMILNIVIVYSSLSIGQRLIPVRLPLMTTLIWKFINGY